MLPPVMLLLGWEEYRRHWLHTGVLLGEVGDRGQGPAQSGEVEGNWTHTNVDNTTPDTGRSHAVTRRSNNEQ